MPKHVLLLILYVLAAVLAAVAGLVPPYAMRLLSFAVAVLALAEVVRVA